MCKNKAIKLSTGDFIILEPLGDRIIRVRMNSSGKFIPSIMERYEIIKTDWDFVNFNRIEDDEKVIVKTSTLNIDISKIDGSFKLEDVEGNILLKNATIFSTKDEIGVGAKFQLQEKEKLYGLGYRQTDFLQLRGNMLRNHVAYGECYGPQPFIMSSCGFGLYYNNTRDSYFDVGSNDKDIMTIWAEKGEVDFFIMVGDYPSLLDSYTQITGRPTLMPQKGYGLMFIGNEKETQFDILNDARDFRKEKIPCDYIGLEPGWMNKNYDVTTEKDWDKEKFYMPWWSEDRKQFKDVTFIGALKRSDFNLSLWLCCDYDVFHEEEKQAAKKEISEDNNSKLKKSFGFGTLDFDPKAHLPIYLDKVTDKEMPWFEHLKKFIDSGVTAFKQDPAYVVNDHPDRLYGNGMTDEEVHNIYTTVLAKQVHQGYREYTGERPMHFMGTSYTGIQKWAPTWTCDCGGRERAFMGMLHNSMVGHMNVTCDMDVHSLEGIHFGFLLPWSQVNSWAFIDHPWWLGEELFEAFKDYARLHYKLMPYIYSYAHVGAKTGMPIIRALPLMYPKDENASNITRQYMFGEYLMVGGFTKEIYVPEGIWFDYWTGEKYIGPKHIEYNPPKGRGGALFIKAGAIIPTWACVNSVGDKQIENIILHIYPEGLSETTLYEDDGRTFDYEENKIAMTNVRCTKKEEETIIEIEPRKGTYKGMPSKRTYTIIIHEDMPSKLFLNDNELEKDDYCVDKEGIISIDAEEDPSLDKSLFVKIVY